MQYAKHRFNIFPDMAPEEYDRLKEDIRVNGFNPKFPIVLFEGGVLDGWNRYRASEDLQIPPRLEFFRGSESEAVALVMQTNKRRNLTSSQWAAIAVEAEDILEGLRAQAKENQVRKPADSVPPSDGRTKAEHGETREKLAEKFNTSKTYITEAQKIKRESPEEFEKVKRGEKSLATTFRERKRATQDEQPEVKDAPAASKELSQPDKDRFFKRANEIVSEINKMPVIYRVKIKQSIKS